MLGRIEEAGVQLSQCTRPPKKHQTLLTPTGSYMYLISHVKCDLQFYMGWFYQAGGAHRSSWCCWWL